jgi:hypothetical protein
MGWRGTIKSINAAHNRIVREDERRIRHQEKEADKYSKKVEKIEDAREKIKLALDNEYAAGRVGDKEYEQLRERMKDISDELLVFGKSAGVTLGKRYVCGKIDHNQFIEMLHEFVPVELYGEKASVIKEVKKRQEDLLQFRSTCIQETDICQKCSKAKGLFRSLYNNDGIMLCNKCTEEYKSLKIYRGFDGIYLAADPCEISDQMCMSVSIKREWL